MNRTVRLEGATTRVLFVPSMSAVRSARASGLTAYDRWITSNLVVAAYCQDAGVPCDDLHGCLETGELKTNYDTLRPQFLKLLLALDRAHSPRLNRDHGRPALHWYFDLFRYYGLLEHAGLVLLSTALVRYVRRSAVGEVHLCGEFGRGLAVLESADYREVIERTCVAEGVRFQFQELPRAGRTMAERSSALYGALHGAAKTGAKRLRDKYRRWSVEANGGRQNGDGSTLLIEPFADLCKLPLANHSVCVWSALGDQRASEASSASASEETIDALNAEIVASFPAMPHADLHVGAMTNRIRSAAGSLERALGRAQATIQKHQVKQAVWENPPTEGAEALLAELLRKSGVRVLGMQHGGCYGTQPVDDVHLLSDYLYCDEFLSYGPSVPEFSTIPDIGLKPAEIVPVGRLKSFSRSPRSSAAASGTSGAEILFPVTMLTDLTFGVPHSPGAIFLSCQAKIVRHLETIGARTVIKPMKNISRRAEYSEKYFPIQHLLRRVRNCCVDESCTFEEALARYRPKLVILEYFSTPLEESVGFDVDIIQLVDPVCPPKPAVRKRLETRVHFADGIDQLLELVDRFVRGDLPRLRSSEFYENHVCPMSGGPNAVTRRLGWDR